MTRIIDFSCSLQGWFILVINPNKLGIEQAFISWQCRARQAAMRNRHGKPDGVAQPIIAFANETKPVHKIITVLCRWPEHSLTPEFIHMAKKSADPAERRATAIRFFSATYFQSWSLFSGMLTASFAPKSSFAAKIIHSKECRLIFDAMGHYFEIACQAIPLDQEHPLRVMTWWHNFLFNPMLHPESEIISFKPDWTQSVSARCLM